MSVQRLVPGAPRLELQRGVERAWEQFVTDGTLSPALRGEIAESWIRTRRAFGIDPELGRPRLTIAPAALEARMRADDNLRLVQPVFEEFSELLADSVLTYFDAQGYMLLIKGSRDIVERLGEAIDFRPGSNWAEESAGTNGPGTALAARQPLEVVSSEHLVRAWHPWSCAAAPFFAPADPAPVGIIDITGPWETQSRQALAMARAVARTVEERLRSSLRLRDEVVRHALRAARDDGEALVAVDRRGRVLGMNEAATRRRLVEGGALLPGMRDALSGVFGPDAPARNELELPWDQGPDLRASPVRFEGVPVGALVRVPPLARARPARPAECAELGLSTRYDFTSIVGADASLKRVVELARIASHNDLPVVLVGESGTGKELFAHAIHAASKREGGPFVVVNCGSIPGELIEAELFGYEPGAFTGARKGGSNGRFEDASGGTIFLDEVSELPPHAQVALLRVLQEKEVARVGASRPRRVDVRVIAATNRPLDDETQSKRFRLDLYFRLSVLKIAIPALRERGADLLLLAQLFLGEAERELDRPGLTLAPDALQVLQGHHWPGNVRELKNVILRAASTAPAERITAQDITLDFTRGDAPRPAAAGPAPGPLAAPAPAPSPAQGTLREAVLASERTRIVEALVLTRWNVARAAQQLGVSRMTLYRLLHKYGIARDGSRR